jgi:hypothetical protein
VFVALFLDEARGCYHRSGGGTSRCTPCRASRRGCSGSCGSAR